MEGIVLQLVIGAVCGIVAAAIASSKGRNTIGWFFGGFFLGIIGIVIVAVLSNKKQESYYRQQAELERRRLREQVMQERMKGESFRGHVARRLDYHDQALGVQTRSLGSNGQGQVAGQLEAGPAGQLGAGSLGAQNAQWYYAMNGQTIGPVAFAQLKGMLANRSLAADTLVWTENLGQWTQADQVSDLRDLG